MDELNEYLNKQYKRYRQRMDFLSWYFGWGIKDEKNFMRWMYGKI